MAMLLPGGDDGEEARPVADINVTPLVDVMLVLLVIFMVTAPMLSAGISVNLPRAAAPPLSPPEPPIELGLTREGQLFLGKEPVAEEALEPRLTEEHARTPDRALHLRADRGIEYGEVLRVMGLVHRAGITRVALVSQPQAAPAQTAPAQTAPAQTTPAQGAPAPAAPPQSAPAGR